MFFSFLNRHSFLLLFKKYRRLFSYLLDAMKLRYADSCLNEGHSTYLKCQATSLGSPRDKRHFAFSISGLYFLEQLIFLSVIFKVWAVKWVEPGSAVTERLLEQEEGTGSPGSQASPEPWLQLTQGCSPAAPGDLAKAAEAADVIEKHDYLPQELELCWRSLSLAAGLMIRSGEKKGTSYFPHFSHPEQFSQRKGWRLVLCF